MVSRSLANQSVCTKGFREAETKFLKQGKEQNGIFIKSCKATTLKNAPFA